MVVDQGEVELAGLEPRDQSLQVVVDDRQRHLWVEAPEAREGRRDERRRAPSGSCRSAAARGAGPAISPSSCSAPSRRAKIPVAWRGQRVAGLGQLDRTCAALDQRQPDLSLQRGDVLADGRLRELSASAAAENDPRAATSESTLQPPHVEHQWDL